jgi:formimidoylglutamate deiminase
MPTFYLPELLFSDATFHTGVGLLVDDQGLIVQVAAVPEDSSANIVRMPGKALLPGLVNGHSHTFQRLIRGVAEHCGANGDDFWAWRNTMYRAASSLEPDELFDVARMAFLEMALSGITAVGEFHYVHRAPDGSGYADANVLAKRVIDAANSVGLRICLLRVAYARAGFDMPPNPGQRRFYETTEEFLEASTELAEFVGKGPSTVSMGVAPHSIRAVRLESLKRITSWAADRRLPIHIHVAEQTAEIVACEREYGARPVALLAQHGLLSERMTLVHAIHTAPEEVDAIATSGSTICSCPTTERNLGDGILAAESAIARGIPFSFGTDSQATINLLEDARELDYHLRLERQRRVVLDRIDGKDISARLFSYATAGGAHSLGINSGRLEPGRVADFFTVDLKDVSIAGSSVEELLPTVVFSLERTAVRDVAVNGRIILADGEHALGSEIVERYVRVAARVATAQW